MTEPTSTPDGGLREAVEALEASLRASGHLSGRFIADELRALLAAHSEPVPTPDSEGCHCPPCPGRGNDGHGQTHCAECCFGTGVEAEYGCPVHHPLAPDSAPDDTGVAKREARVECDSICDAASGGSCFTPWCLCRCHKVRRETATPDADDTPPLGGGDVALTEAEREQYERIEDSGNTQGLAWQVEQTVKAHVEADRAAREVAAKAEVGERIAQAIEALPGPNNKGVALWRSTDAREGYLLAVEEAARAARIEVRP